MIAKTIVHKYLSNIKTNPNQLIYNYLEEGNQSAQTVLQSYSNASSIALNLLNETKKGERALLLYPPGIHFLDAFWACQLAGVIAVPVPLTPDLEQVQNRLSNVHKDCEAAVLLTNSQILPVIEYQKTQVAKGAIPQKIIATDEYKTKTIATNQFSLPSLDDIALLQYTSGSVSKPKGVKITHKNITSNLNVINSFTGAAAMDNGCGWLPHFHDMGLIGQFLIPALIPRPFHFNSPLSFIHQPLSWLKMISDYKSNIIVAPNFAFELCSKTINEEEKWTLDLSSVEVALTGSEPVNASVLNRFAENFEQCGFNKNAFIPCYGMAEATLMISGTKKGTGFSSKKLDAEALKNNVVKPSKNSNKDLVSCGFISDAFDLKIVENKNACKENKIGEIWISGDSVTKGYWKNRDENKFDAYLNTGEGPFFKTGDLGFISDKELFITGRIKELIIIRGKNFYPADIEATATQSNNNIRKGCVAAFSELNQESESLTLCVELKNSCINPNFENIVTDINVAILKQHSIKSNKIYLLKAKQLPKTTSGKMQRLKAKAQLNNKTILPLYTYIRTISVESAKANPIKIKLENFIINEIAKLCEVPVNKITLNDCIFNFGLESIQLPLLLDKIKKQSGKNINIEMLISAPSIDGIVKNLLKIKSQNQLITQPLKIEKPTILKHDFVLPNFNILDQ